MKLASPSFTRVLNSIAVDFRQEFSQRARADTLMGEVLQVHSVTNHSVARSAWQCSSRGT